MLPPEFGLAYVAVPAGGRPFVSRRRWLAPASLWLTSGARVSRALKSNRSRCSSRSLPCRSVPFHARLPRFSLGVLAAARRRRPRARARSDRDRNARASDGTRQWRPIALRGMTARSRGAPRPADRSSLPPPRRPWPLPPPSPRLTLVGSARATRVLVMAFCCSGFLECEDENERWPIQ